MRPRAITPNGVVLSDARRQRAWTQANLAERADCSIRRVSDAEAGRPVSPQILNRMAKAVGIAYELLVKKQESSLASFDLLPPRPLMVVGRENELSKLIGRFEPDPKRKSSIVQAVLAVHGWPGVGKTTLAAELLYRTQIKAIFPDGMLWTSLGPAPDVARLLACWARALGVEDSSIAANIDELSQRIAGKLANRRSLLVVDDVWEAAHARPFMVGGSSCGMLLTTRLPRVADDLTPSPAHRYLLDVLSDAEAIDLLERLTPRSVRASHSDCLELVQIVEGLPLAIQVAGRLLEAEAQFAPNAQRDAAVVKSVVKDIRSRAARFLQELAPADMSDLVSQTTPTVAALLRKSTDHLSEHVRERFAYLGAFAPKPAVFRLEDMAAVWESSAEEAQETARVLVARGLLEPLGEGKYWMHALLVSLAASLCKE